MTIVAGREEHLARQQQALARGTAVTHVVVGMGPQPGSTVTLQADGALPLARARNAGADIALAEGAELLVFLDVDCIPGPTLVERYADAAARCGPTLLCGPVTYLPPGSTDLVPDPHPARPDPPDGALVPEDRRELFWSLSFAVTGEAWHRSGGFCEEYRGYGAEDTDFALTARDRGLAMAWVGGAHAFHQHHPPTRHDPARVAEIVANARLFHRRWGTWPMTGWLQELAAAGAVEFDPTHDHLTTGAQT
ncbi:galactosyltransferase-related protein [Pseudonocardia xishanensis]|uniref:Glycosyltransferase n=1 Tax=Pseudonocardia xishanensis TaxID=630995 RepID=A0ABP8S4G6_9PSEU